MKIYILRKEQLIRKPIDKVFRFFENPSIITPPSLRFAILTPQPVSMKEGTIIDYTIRVLVFSVHWRSIITSYQPPHRFVDIQLKGPYAFWHHTHSFFETDEGTMIIDEVHYALPLGVIGRLVHNIAVRRKLDSIFDYRVGIIAEVFPK